MSLFSRVSTSGAFYLNMPALDRPDLMQKSPLGRAARVVNMSELGKALNTLSHPPVKAVFVYNSNPAVVAPNHNDVVRGFMRRDLFTVVHEQFFTDTTTYADIVLPATTFLEHKDLNKAYGHTFLQISNQAIAPLGESRSNTDVFRDLAQRMGFTDDCFQQSTDDVIDATLTRAENQQLPKGWERWMEGMTRERLEKEGHVRLNLGDGPFLPFAKGGYWNPQGPAIANLNNSGPHGLSEVLYAYTSASENNGSAFAGITVNTPWYDLTLGLCMLFGRFLFIIPSLAAAGSLASQQVVPTSAGTLPTHGPLFVGLLVATVIVVGALTFFPALALGPIVEHFLMQRGTLFSMMIASFPIWS